MNRNLLMASVLLPALVALVGLGCGDDHDGHMTDGMGHTTTDGDTPLLSASTSNPVLVSLWPSNGLVEVPLDGSIHLKFNVPMDTGSITTGFFMAHGEDMQAWMDSLGHMGDDSGGMGGGGMGGGHCSMDMGDMMDWMDSMGVHGEMHWNDDMDSCVFMPDSAMMPECDYMIMMDMGGMMSHDGHMMDTTGHEHGLDMYHFTTGLPELTARRIK